MVQAWWCWWSSMCISAAFKGYFLLTGRPGEVPCHRAIRWKYRSPRLLAYNNILIKHSKSTGDVPSLVNNLLFRCGRQDETGKTRAARPLPSYAGQPPTFQFPDQICPLSPTANPIRDPTASAIKPFAPQYMLRGNGRRGLEGINHWEVMTVSQLEVL